MTRETRDILHTGTRIFKLIALAGVSAAAITTALTFFAKAKTVQMLDHRIGLNTSRDVVDNREGRVRWMKQQAAFENRKNPPTFAEKEMIKAAENELTEQKKLHDQRVEHFEETYEQQF